MDNAAKGIIGLAIRAGRVSFGVESVKTSVRNGKTNLVLLSENASDRCKKDINDICSHYNVELITGDYSEMFTELTSRNAMKVISINDSNFSKGIKAKIALL